MCFGPSILGAGAKTRLESRIKTFTPHGVCRYIQLNFTAANVTNGTGEGAAVAGGTGGGWQPDNTTLTMQFINTAAPRVGNITFSDPMLDTIQALHVTSAASNFMSIPTDCPQRAERLGWMGDAYTSGETQLHNFDLAGAYSSWLDQIEDNMVDNATSPNYGAVPDCVPFYGGHCHLPSSPSWGQAYPSIANWVFEYYDDAYLLAKHYPFIKLYTDSLTHRAYINDKTNHTLLDTGGWGDWCSPGGCGGKGTCGGSHDYISTIRIAKAWAAAMDNAADLAKYTALEDKVVTAFDTAYYTAAAAGDGEQGKPGKSGYNCQSTTPQTANSLGLQVSPGSPAALTALLADITAKTMHLDTGIVGTKWLFESLAQSGRADVALQVITNPTYPGYVHLACSLCSRCARARGCIFGGTTVVVVALVYTVVYLLCRSCHFNLCTSLHAACISPSPSCSPLVHV